MLDFLLVLGLIPGTDFQITFYEIIIFCLAGAAWIFRAQLRLYLLVRKQQFIAYLKQKLWEHRQLSLPV